MSLLVVGSGIKWHKSSQCQNGKCWIRGKNMKQLMSISSGSWSAGPSGGFSKWIWFDKFFRVPCGVITILSAMRPCGAGMVEMVIDAFSLMLGPDTLTVRQSAHISCPDCRGKVLLPLTLENFIFLIYFSITFLRQINIIFFIQKIAIQKILIFIIL